MEDALSVRFSNVCLYYMLLSSHNTYYRKILFENTSQVFMKILFFYLKLGLKVQILILICLSYLKLDTIIVWR